MKVKLFIIFYLLIIIINSCSQGNLNYKLYKNKDAKFSFKYSSKKFTIYESYDNIKSNGKFNIVIQIDPISKLYDHAPYGFDKETALLEMKSLEKGKVGSGIDVAQDIELVKIGNIYGEIITVLSRHSIEDISFERRLLFFNNNYRIILTVYGNDKKIIDSMPNFFSYDKESKSYSWIDKSGSDSVTDFFNSIKKVDKGNPVVIWFNSIYDIIEKIKLN